MNFIAKNLKTLRVRMGLTQKQFSINNNVTIENLKGYERGVKMKIELYLDLMEAHDLDPIKFRNLDMELHDVSKVSDPNQQEQPMGSAIKEIDEINPYSSQADRYKYLDELSSTQLLQVCKNFLRDKEVMQRELTTCQSAMSDLQQRVINLQSGEEVIKQKS